jgi:malonyl-CoA O-methyltransferase
MDNNPYQLDKKLVRESFDRAAARYDEVAVLQRKIGRRLLERLDLIKLQPQRIVDIGAGTGELSTALTKRYKGSEVLTLDLSPAMLKHARQRRGMVDKWFGKQHFVCADLEQLPLADNSADMIFSNFAIQWCSDLDLAFSEFQRVLRSNGLLLFTTFGPDTLKELRQAWRAVDDNIHVNSFIDMHDIGDALLRARLSDPVMDTERLTLTYKDGMDLMHDLKAMGAHNVTCGRNHALTGKQKLKRMLIAYEQFRSGAGRLPATHEVVYGHAWGSDAKPDQQLRDGTAHIPLSEIKFKR